MSSEFLLFCVIPCFMPYSRPSFSCLESDFQTTLRCLLIFNFFFFCIPYINAPSFKILPVVSTYRILLLSELLNGDVWCVCIRTKKNNILQTNPRLPSPSFCSIRRKPSAQKVRNVQFGTAANRLSRIVYVLLKNV